MYKNEKNGLVEDYYTNEQVRCRCTVNEGKIIDKRECFYKDGNVWVVEFFSNGLFNGINYMLNENQDTVYIERYQFDTLYYSKNFRYYKNGNLKEIREINYVDSNSAISYKKTITGIRTTLKEKELSNNKGFEIRYHMNGTVSDSLFIENGLYNGVSVKYNEVGNLVSLSYLKDNVYDGLYTEYYESGIIKLKATYSLGKLDGELIEYDESGIIIKRSLFSKGKKIAL